MQNLCGNTKEEIVKTLKMLHDICESNNCIDCPFGTDNDDCLFAERIPENFRIEEKDLIWRAAH